MNLEETRRQIFTAIDKEQANKTRIGIDLLIAEIERHQADSRALAALREAAQVVIRRVDDGTTRELGTVVSSDPMFAVVLSQSEINALRLALAEVDRSPQ